MRERAPGRRSRVRAAKLVTQGGEMAAASFGVSSGGAARRAEAVQEAHQPTDEQPGFARCAGWQAARPRPDMSECRTYSTSTVYRLNYRPMLDNQTVYTYTRI